MWADKQTNKEQRKQDNNNCTYVPMSNVAIGMFITDVFTCALYSSVVVGLCIYIYA